MSSSRTIYFNHIPLSNRLGFLEYRKQHLPVLFAHHEKDPNLNGELRINYRKYFQKIAKRTLQELSSHSFMELSHLLPIQRPRNIIGF